MSWFKILKVELRPADIKHLGSKYAIKDMYESMLITEEEYNKLPEAPPSGRRGRGPTGKFGDKMSYHTMLKTFLEKNKDSPFYDGVSKYWTFHNTMYRRLQKQKFGKGFLYETYPTLELFEASGTKGKQGKRKRRVREKPQDPVYSKMVRMLENLFEVKGIKSQEEVESMIGRKLKDSEIQAYENVAERLTWIGKVYWKKI